MLIDPRVHYVGGGFLRQMNADFLRRIEDHLFVIQYEDEPVSVVMAYDQYLKMLKQVRGGPPPGEGERFSGKISG